MRKQFKNPPIKEAIFTIYFKETIVVEKLNLFRDTSFVKEVFPNYIPNFAIEFSNKINANKDPLVEKSLLATHKQQGFTLKGDNDLNKLIQLFPTHLSYHNFNQYAGWDSMYKELRYIWSEFCQSVGENELSRISVRYINQLFLPLPLPNTKNLSVYINLLPKMPKGINSINNFFLQIGVPSKDNEMQGVITETLLQNVQNSEKQVFLIDLTVSKVHKFDCKTEEIWNWFTKIREFKNELFFSCITKKTEQLFN